MSDGQRQLLDLFSGDPLLAFNSCAGVVAAVQFHERDLLLASFSDPVVRWGCPAVHTAMAEATARGGRCSRSRSTTRTTRQTPAPAAAS
jgi:hypothetical protein